MVGLMHHSYLLCLAIASEIVAGIVLPDLALDNWTGTGALAPALAWPALAPVPAPALALVQ